MKAGINRKSILGAGEQSSQPCWEKQKTKTKVAYGSQMADKMKHLFIPDPNRSSAAPVCSVGRTQKRRIPSARGEWASVSVHAPPH